MMVGDGMRILSWRMLVLALLLVCWSGCGGDSDPRSMHYKGRWGGMSEEEWLAQHEKRQKEEEEEERRAQEEARRRLEEERRKQEEEARQQAAARRKARTGNGPAPAGNHSGQQTNSPESSDEEGSPPPKPKPQLPEAFDQWKPEHFLLARRQFPERFVEAVGHLAQARRGDPELVELLLDVVWTEKAPGSGSSTDSGRSQHTEAILRAVADALAQQQTPKAADALRQLLSGQTPTEDHPTAIRCVLGALAAQPTPDHDRLLLQAVLGPENLLAASSALQAQGLQQEALRTITNQARPELQEQLAAYVDQPALAPPIRQRIEQAFLPNRWDHFRANVVLAQSRRTSASARSAIMRQFALWSAEAVQILLLPEGVHRPADQLARAQQTAETIWNPAFAPALEGLLASAALVDSTDLGAEQTAAQLAMTIPAGWARRLLADWLTHRWPHRPEGIRKQVEQLAFEPGFLALVGRLIAEEIGPLAEPAAKSAAGKPAKPAKERQQAIAPAAKEWFALAELASLRLSERIAQEVTAGGLGRQPSQSDGQSAETTALPLGLALPLPPQAKPFCQWQGEIGARVETLGWKIPQEATFVYFSRWQLDAAPQELAPRLERALPKARRRQADSSLLVESFSKHKESGGLRMVQIRIRPLRPEIPRSLQEQQPLLLELLAVQIAEPTSATLSARPAQTPLGWVYQPQKRDRKPYRDFTESLLAVNNGRLQ